MCVHARAQIAIHIDILYLNARAFRYEKPSVICVHCDQLRQLHSSILGTPLHTVYLLCDTMQVNQDRTMPEPLPHRPAHWDTHTYIRHDVDRLIYIYIYIYIYHLYTRKETWARSPATSCSGRRSCTPIRCRTTTCRRCCSSVMAKVSGVRYYSTAVCARSRMLYTYTAHVCVGYVKAVAATRRWWLLARCKRCRRVYICGREKTGKQTGNFAGI